MTSKKGGHPEVSPLELPELVSRVVKFFADGDAKGLVRAAAVNRLFREVVTNPWSGVGPTTSIILSVEDW